MSKPIITFFCVPVDGRPNIYGNGGDVRAYAADANGKTIAEHYCSSEDFAKSYLCAKGEVYKERYPEGYMTVWRDAPPANWEGLTPPPNSGTETPTPMTDGVARAMEIFESATRIKPSPAQLIELSATLERRVNRLKGLLERARHSVQVLNDEYGHEDLQTLLSDIDAEGKE